MKTQREKHENLLELRLDLFPSFVERFLKNNMGPKQSTTLLSYARDIEQFLNWLIVERFSKAETIKEISLETFENLFRDDIEDYRAFLRRQKNNEGEFLSIATINRKFSALKTMFKYLSKTDSRETRKPYLSRNVMEQIELIPNPDASEDMRLENIQNSILVSNEIHEFRNFVIEGYGKLEEVRKNKRKFNRWEHNKERDAAIISLLLGSGLRIAELSDIALKDIDLQDRKVKVHRKSGNKRSVSFSLKAYIHLMDYLKVRNDKYNVQGEIDEPLFLSLYGGNSKVMDKRSIQKMIAKYAGCFGKPQLTAHKLRHSFATNHASKINSIPMLQKILDHANPGTTMIYTKIFESELQESVDKADI